MTTNRISESAITGGRVTTLTDAAEIEWDASTGMSYQVTLSGNHKFLNPTNVLPGSLYILRITQGAGGSHMPTWGDQYTFPDGTAPTLSTAEGAIDILLFHYGITTFNLVSKALNVSKTVAAPSDLTASTDETGQITLNWVNNALDATSNRVQQFDGLSWNDIQVVAGDATSYVDTETPGSYTYRIVAYRGASPSQPSNEATGVSN